ncbi:hypothetical protein SGLAM104S_01825 [Streptomyces glaucescens]
MQGLEPPLLGADAVGVRDGGRHERETGGEQGAEQGGPVSRAAAGSGLLRGGDDGGAQTAFDAVGEALRLVAEAAWAGAVVAPERVASAAGCGSSTARPSAAGDGEDDDRGVGEHGDGPGGALGGAERGGDGAFGA